MSTSDASSPCTHACDDHLPSSRRAFLRGAGAALGALAMLGLSTEEAIAIPVRLLAGTATREGVRYPIPAEDAVVFDNANDLILVRQGANVWAFVAACPHKEVVKIKWLKGEGRFQCPKHESKYKPDGTFIEGKATRNLDRLPIKRDGNDVVVDVDRAFLSDKQADGWASAVVVL